jgi:peptidoglycan hydrolase CwlO-like protein
MSKTQIKYLVVTIMLFGMLVFSACSGISEGQKAEQDLLRSEVKALEKEVGSLKTEKATIEREITDKNAQLDQCAKEKAELKKNLTKLGY